MVNRRSTLAVVAIAAAWLTLAPTESAAQKRQRDRITRDEILASPHKDLDLYQVIRSLRPHFLEGPPGVRTLGGSYGPAPVAVYVEGVRETGTDALRTLPALRVEEVRYLDPTRAENEYGPRANGGALAVRLYKAPKGEPAPSAASRDSTKPAPR